ncbi:MAG: nucleotidyltransferase domain-containing protein [Gemmatimonadetes bacterium]|nr:nucleotidyltransferase domain-containing protein [Gemmatimonadota bacterium]
MTATEAIQTIRERIEREFQPERVVLFGSYARGTAQRGSDVDILVVLREVADKRAAAIAIRRSLVDLAIAKDILVSTPQEIAERGHLVGTVLRSPLRDGKILYERG